MAIYEMDWQVNINTVGRPDVMVLCEEPEGNFVEKAPTLVVEILSPSTRDKDLTANKKFMLDDSCRISLVVDDIF